MPFGIKIALSHFQQVMNIILGDLIDVCLLVYLDDILIYSSIAEDYTRHIRAVIEQLVMSKLYLKYKKCALLLLEVESLGYLVSECGVLVPPGKVSAMWDWPVPSLHDNI